MLNPPGSEYMKISEAAHFLGVTQRWVYRRVLSGELPASKVGGLYFINRRDLQSLLEGGRVVAGPADTLAEGSSLPRLKCGFCYRLLDDESEVGGLCEKDGCGDIICQKCWELNIHSCARHSPTRDQRLQKAEEQKQAGRLKVLVKAGAARLGEKNFLNRIHAHLSGFSTLIHPASGEALNIPSWDEILEEGDDRAGLMHLLGKVVLDSATTSQMPLNAWHHYAIKTKIKKASPLELHVQAVSRMEGMVRDGFDTEPLSTGDLNTWIEKLVEVPAKSGNFRLVLLASTTGWDEAARAVVTGGPGQTFTHRLALLYLYDMAAGELIYNNGDDRARRYAELFRPVLADEELAEIIQAVNVLMGVHDSLTLDEAQKSLAFEPEKVKKAFERMSENGEFVLTEIKGLGATLVKHQAL
ncbi:MAG: helix-turn-helix domain-containing protein [Anaerolineaceae bacterium]